MSHLKKGLQYIYTIYAFLIFLFFMFLLFPFVVLASLLGRVRGGNVIYYICRFWSYSALFLWGMWHKNEYEEKYDPNHPAVYVFNHISYIDIPLILIALRKQTIRILAKAEMGKIPIFGFIYKSATVTVDRSSNENRQKSVQTLKSFLQKNISVVIAPEGTFNTTGKPLAPFYDGAFRIAIETQTPIRPVVLLDAYDRMNYHSIFSMTTGGSRAIFLPEISVAGYNLSQVEELKQLVFSKMEDKLVEHNASWIIK